MYNKGVLKFRGLVEPQKVVPKIQASKYDFLLMQKIGFYISYIGSDYSFHAVDRFASFPLFYTVYNNKPYVSEKIDDLIPYLKDISFNPIGYYGTGGIMKGERSNDTPFAGVKRLLPGHYLEYKAKRINIKCYWSFSQLKGYQFKGTYNEAIEELGFLVCQAVKRHYQFAPDAALHLSGGLDSGTIAALFSKYSSRKILALALTQANAPIQGEIYESGFMKAYKEYAPNLTINYFHPEDINIRRLNFYPDADNWYDIPKEGVQSKVANLARKQNKKVILTGLGGDELASYGHRNQNSLFTVSNDIQANLFLNLMIRKKNLGVQWVKGILGRDGHVIDSLRSTNIYSNTFSNSNWYTKSFISCTSSIFKAPIMALHWYPVSYKYRLELLDRSYFTVRSDQWNFIGRHYDIDYMHPLLDVDLVEFSASIPPKYFRRKTDRELFKKAMRKHLPSRLLKGTKRPGFYKKDYSRKDTMDLIISVHSTVQKLSKTFAGTVYDYFQMDRMLKSYIKMLHQIPESHIGTYRIINLNLIKITILNNRGHFLNKFFT